MTPLKATPAEAREYQRNLARQGTAKRQSLNNSDVTLAQARSACVTALQVAAARALDMADVDRRTRQRVLMSPEFNRHCLKASRELARKIKL